MCIKHSSMHAAISASQTNKMERKGAAMLLRPHNCRSAFLLFLAFELAIMSITAKAVSCKTQSQMTAPQRDVLSNAVRIVASEVLSGDVQALRANTIPQIAADFDGIAASIETLRPLLPHAVITIEALYELDASSEPAGTVGLNFYCGTPVVVLNFAGLPQGMYALAILHATGVQQPQQISLVLSETTEHRWMLGGLYSKPMMVAGHDGLWYWVSARKYAQRNMNWDAWFYYRMAANSLDPVEFLSSPNLEKLQREEDQVRPDNLPGIKPLTLEVQGSVFQVTGIDTTAAFSALDLEVHYAPDDAQIAQLHDPPTARKQVSAVMTALVALHPELQDAFHGIWVQADHGASSVFSLELTMSQIVAETAPTARGPIPAVK
jgi:hypothetical protein